MNKFILFLSLTLITSCASLTEQGYKALEEGKTEEALALFQKAAQKDKDPKTQEGLRKTQKQWVEKKLIEVRLLRLGKNFGSSESLLKEIILKQTEWQVFPTGAAFATQNEEIELYSVRVNERIQTALKDKNPLLAQFEFKQHQFILNQALKQNTSMIKTQI